MIFWCVVVDVCDFFFDFDVVFFCEGFVIGFEIDWSVDEVVFVEGFVFVVGDF